MSRRRQLERHRQSLAEIRDIMNSMKTLAYMETRKLSRFLPAQQAVVNSLERVAADLLSFHGDALNETLVDHQAYRPLFVLVGSERGFCGDFNHALQRHLQSALQVYEPNLPAVIAIGRKLHTLFEELPMVVGRLEGASVAEEVGTVLNGLVEEILGFQSVNEAPELFCLYHGSEDGVVMQRLLPPFQGLATTSASYSNPPLLNLSPERMMLELTDHYLFASLHAILYSSLMEENHQRVTHLDSAVNHLDDQALELSRQCNALRQEEIIEEIEVILLNYSSLGEHPERTEADGARPG